MGFKKISGILIPVLFLLLLPNMNAITNSLTGFSGSFIGSITFGGSINVSYLNVSNQFLYTGQNGCLSADANGLVTGNGIACGSGTGSINTNDLDIVNRTILNNDTIIRTGNLTSLDTINNYCQIGDFNLGNISNYTQYIRSTDFNLGNISNSTPISRTFNATGFNGINATLFLNNTKIYNNGSGICIVKC